jgi:hypothetical protein
MLEYGNGVGEVAGRATGGGGASGPSTDMGATLGQFVTDSVNTISTMPPAALLAGVVLIFLGLILLKRAF